MLADLDLKEKSFNKKSFKKPGGKNSPWRNVVKETLIKGKGKKLSPSKKSFLDYNNIDSTTKRIIEPAESLIEVKAESTIGKFLFGEFGSKITREYMKKWYLFVPAYCCAILAIVGHCE